MLSFCINIYIFKNKIKIYFVNKKIRLIEKTNI